jgi:hypothetical protein
MDELTRAGAASTWGVCTCSMGTLDGSADGPRPGVRGHVRRSIVTVRLGARFGAPAETRNADSVSITGGCEVLAHAGQGDGRAA